MARSLLRTVPDRALKELASPEPDWEPTGVERPRPEPQTGPVATLAPFCIWGASPARAANRRTGPSLQNPAYSLSCSGPSTACKAGALRINFSQRLKPGAVRGPHH